MSKGIKFILGCLLSLHTISSSGAVLHNSDASDSISTSLNCSPWSELTADGSRCECKRFAKHLKATRVWCFSNNTASLPFCYCMSYIKEFNTTVVGYCVVRCYVLPSDPGRKVFTGNHRYQVIVNSYNLSEFNEETCRSLQMNRTGQMCGKCVSGYSPPVYSYSLACVNCTDYKYNWIKYIAVAYLPLTVFFVIVITFRISAASGAMNGFILTSQIVASPAVLNYLKRMIDQKKTNEKIITGFYGIWNLDFFRLFYAPFCLHPNMTAIQTRALDYGVAVYPLLLVVITYIFASLHYRYPTVVSLWKPFYKCFRFLRKEWDIRNSLIGAFATFILLSYVKILNVSLDLLTPVTLYDKNGNSLKQLYLNMDGNLKYFEMEHLPYAILALVMAFIFNFLPLMLLCLFPCQCFHKCLNFFQIQREALREFVMVFQGEFRDQPRDYRYFAGFYLLMRIVNLLLIFHAKGILYFSCATVLFAASSFVIATFRPYRKPLYNYTDSLLSFTTAVCFIGVPMYELTIIIMVGTELDYLKQIWLVIAFIQPVYGICLLIGIFLPILKWTRQVKAKFIKTLNQFRGISEPEDRVPYRLDHMNEYPPLLPPSNNVM